MILGDMELLCPSGYWFGYIPGLSAVFPRFNLCKTNPYLLSLFIIHICLSPGGRRMQLLPLIYQKNILFYAEIEAKSN